MDSRGQTELHYESTSRAIIRCKGKLCKRSGTREFTIFTTVLRRGEPRRRTRLLVAAMKLPAGAADTARHRPVPKLPT